MKNFNAGGNPQQDRLESIQRFNEIIEPVFGKKGFIRLKGNSQVMYNGETNTVVMVTSCPSQVKMVGYTKSKIREYRKVYGKDVKIFIYYTRDYSEWRDKVVYQSTLRNILSLKSLTGISTGLNNLQSTLSSIVNGEPFWCIG